MRTGDYADLDELVVTCRAEGARASFAEAVACYRAGAYRAAIVATWTAVTFDYIAKLRELDLSGNKEAERILADFENARQHEDVKTSLRLEGELLDSPLAGQARTRRRAGDRRLGPDAREQERRDFL